MPVLVDRSAQPRRRHRSRGMRIPVASAIALATAAIGGTIRIRRRRGAERWRGFGTSTMTASIIGTSGATDSGSREARVFEPPILVVDVFSFSAQRSLGDAAWIWPRHSSGGSQAESCTAV